MVQLTVNKTAGLLDGQDVELYFSSHAAVSDDPTAVSVINAGNNTIGVHGLVAGESVNIHCTRLSDGDTFDLPIDVVDPLPDFTVHLGNQV